MRKIYAIEYDEQGNEVEKLEIGGQELLSDLGYCTSGTLFDPLYCLPKAQRDLFTKDQWKTILRFQYPVMSVDIDSCIKFFDMEENQKKLVEYIVTEYPFGGYPKNEFHQHLGCRSIDFEKAVEIIKEITESKRGLYIAATYDGTWHYTFPDGITKKQAKYQERKGRRIIFLNYKDFKEYTVNIDELD